MLSSSTRVSCSMPSPETPLRVTTYEAPLPVTTNGLAAATVPVDCRAKSAASTPLTAPLKRMVNETVDALMGVEGPFRKIDATLGGLVVSTVHEELARSLTLPA